MRESSARDFAVGLFVVGGLAAVAYLSLQVGGLAYTGPGGLRLAATFDDIGGLTARSPVVIAGVKVGRVVSIELDDDLRARVALDLDPSLALPVDTTGAIRTSGLLGDQFVLLEPVAEEEQLRSGDSLAHTESALQLEKLIGALVHGSEIEEEP
jgi:phospholipid/cholesterol/gamma-HCH transport system substrate-binding protein